MAVDYNYFRKAIKKILNECAYPVFLVCQDETKKCTCIDDATNQPNTECKKCLGTGYKVTIKIIKAASQEEMKDGATISATNSRVVRNYYVDSKYPVFENNYIIDDNKVYYVFRLERLKGLHNESSHQQIKAVLKTDKHSTILNNCLEIINAKLPKSKRGDFPWLH